MKIPWFIKESKLVRVCENYGQVIVYIRGRSRRIQWKHSGAAHFFVVLLGKESRRKKQTKKKVLSYEMTMEMATLPTKPLSHPSKPLCYTGGKFRAHEKKNTPAQRKNTLERAQTQCKATYKWVSVKLVVELFGMEFVWNAKSRGQSPLH